MLGRLSPRRTLLYVETPLLFRTMTTRTPTPASKTRAPTPPPRATASLDDEATMKYVMYMYYNMYVQHHNTWFVVISVGFSIILQSLLADCI